MGILPETKIVVSSVVSNLAGDYTKRPNYLKSLITGNIVTGNSEYLTKTINSGYATGPGTKMKRFFDWSLDGGNFGSIGMPTMKITGNYTNAIDINAIRQAISPSYWFFVHLHITDAGGPDPYYWALQWVTANHIADIFAAWTCDYDSLTNTLTISYPSHWSTTINPTDLDPDGYYVYAVWWQESLPLGGGLSIPGLPRASAFIYKVGTGNAALDAASVLINQKDNEFFPHIPIRSFDTFLSSSTSPIPYSQAKAALKKSLGLSFDALVTELSSHPDLAQMDFAYVAFGVALNTRDKFSKKYLYNFFKNLIPFQAGTGADYTAFKANQATYQAAMDAWEAWKAGGSVGTEPTVPPIPGAPISEVKINVPSSTTLYYDMRIQWRYVEEEFGTGLKDVAYGANDIWFDVDVRDEFPLRFVDEGESISWDNLKSDVVKLNWQIDDNNWKSLTLVGFTHKNYIYGAQYVETHMIDALGETEDSKFIVPLHKPTMGDLGLVGSTQVSTECAYLIINCFQIYETGFIGAFLPFLTFATILVTSVLAAPLAPGLLGTNLSVGTAVGFTGLTAAVVGAVLNTIAAMIVVKILQKASIAILGDKLGQIIGAVLGFVAVTLGSPLMSGQSLSAAWGNMMSATNLLNLANTIGGGVAAYIQASTMDVMEKTQALQDDYKKQSEMISDMFAQNIGYGTGTIDPMGLTESAIGNYVESSADFLSRTLLTGSDIAEISMNMLTDFARLTTQTTLPGIAGD